MAARLAASLLWATGSAAAAAGSSPPLPAVTRELRAFWAFQEPAGAPKIDSVRGYILADDNATRPAPSVADSPGLFGPRSVSLDRHRLSAKRDAVPAVVNISGPHASVTVVAWIKIGRQHGGGFVGGVWEEADAWRQFALFLDGTAGCPARNGTVAHISGAGGPESGHRYCESAACGATDLGDGKWHCVANVYDGAFIRAYVDGALDNHTAARPSRNPFTYPDPPEFPVGGIFTPPPGKGADLAVGANFVHPGGGVGPSVLANIYTGLVGGFGVYATALSDAEVARVCAV